MEKFDLPDDFSFERERINKDAKKRIDNKKAVFIEKYANKINEASKKEIKNVVINLMTDIGFPNKTIERIKKKL